MYNKCPTESSVRVVTPATATNAKKWRFGKALSRIHSGTLREGRGLGSSMDFEPESTIPLSPAATATDRQSIISVPEDGSCRQLQDYIYGVNLRRSHCDNLYKEYAKVRDQCNSICKNLLTQQAETVLSRLNRQLTMESIDEDSPPPLSPKPAPAPAPAKTGTSVSSMAERLLGTPTMFRRGSSLDSPSIPSGFDQRSSMSGSSTPDATKLVGGPLSSSMSAATKDPPPMAANVNVVWLATIRDWKNCLEALSTSLRSSLADTYKQYEPNASKERIDQLFSDRMFRRHAVESMRHASVYKMLSASPDFWPEYSIRFRNYEKAHEDLVEIRALLQAGESGIAPDRMIREVPIAPRGDAILEFSNTMLGDSRPVYRFRVSSHMLAETSPIFARMFTGNSDGFNLNDDEEDEIMDHLPPPPAIFVCKDGTEAKLFRMPQSETNEENAFTTLLHAAHIHNDKIPRDIPFAQFVAIACACLRYRCTSPLEMVVEHRWLPQWMHKASEDMPDGLLLISYVFGLRRLFTKTTKSAIMNLKSEEELHSKNWPNKIKEKAWAIRSAKIAQVEACCAYTVEEYIRPNPSNPTRAGGDIGTGNPIYENRALPLSGAPRCPKGSHWCDATNLGWMLLVYNEMQMLHTVMKPGVLGPNPSCAPRSLSQMVDTLSRAGSAPHPVHTGIACDPAPAFRSAIHDIYNSVSGLTLYGISGTRHGWALSQHQASEPQPTLEQTLSTSDPPQPRGPRVGLWSLPEKLRLNILGKFDNIDDLHAAARVGKAWYETFKGNELSVMRATLRAGRRRITTQRTNSMLTTTRVALASSSNGLKTDVDAITTQSKTSDEFEEESIMIDEDEYRDGDGDEDEIEVVLDYLPLSTDRTTKSGNETLWQDVPKIIPEEPESFMSMTREEAEQILWPDIPPSSPLSKPSLSIPDATVARDVLGSREKFRARDCASMAELKSLAYIEDKKLRDEQDIKLRGKQKGPECQGNAPQLIMDGEGVDMSGLNRDIQTAVDL